MTTPTKLQLFRIIVGRGGNIYEARDSLQVEMDDLVTQGYIPDGPITIQTGTEPQEQEPRSEFGRIQMMSRLPDLKIVHLTQVMKLAALPATEYMTPEEAAAVAEKGVRLSKMNPNAFGSDPGDERAI